jgi:hypothetical protein
MADPRYIRVNGRPLFLVYRPYDLPDSRRTLDVWRHETTRLGLPEPFFVASNSHAHLSNPMELGFDGVMQFVPQLSVLDCFESPSPSHRLHRLVANIKQGIFSSRLHVYDYEESVRKMLVPLKWPVFRSLIPGWDNSARSGERGVILRNSTPAKFEQLLLELSQRTLEEQPPGHRILFLNAWNEWAEGNHLEPDQRNGRGYLEAVRQVKDRLTTQAKNVDRLPVQR